MSDKIFVPEDFRSALISIAESKKLFIEGNIVKLLDDSDDESFKKYIKDAIENDKDQRKRRLEVTRQVQSANKELTKKKEEIELRNKELTEKQDELDSQNKQLMLKQNENESLMSELQDALKTAENAKEEAINDLSLMQQKTQFELIGMIVKTALIVIAAVGVITTILYGYAMYYSSSETTLIGNTWSNLFGILLTNSFSIIGTIMGVKYASDNRQEERAKG